MASGSRRLVFGNGGTKKKSKRLSTTGKIPSNVCSTTINGKSVRFKLTKLASGGVLLAAVRRTGEERENAKILEIREDGMLYRYAHVSEKLHLKLKAMVGCILSKKVRA